MRHVRLNSADRRRLAHAAIATALLLLLADGASAAAEEAGLNAQAIAVLQRYCIDCHGNESAEARINLAHMSDAPDFGRGFKDWEKVIGMLRQRKMPPQKSLQPADAERDLTVISIERALDAHIEKHAGDPGAVVLRRLTSAEYAYTIQDLTGLDLRLERGFVSDAVGGEGFTNTGNAQFMQDATLERYLEAAKAVAEHAVIGAGPLAFFAHPGETGRELSAIQRIQQISRDHGFRTAAGEGAKPFGLDLYPRAFYVAWRYRHRAALGLGDEIGIPRLAREEGLSVRFCEHVWKVVNAPATSFPLSTIVAQWQSLREPSRQSSAEVRTACEEISRSLRDWQKTLASAAGDAEEAAVLTDGDVPVKSEHSFITGLSWPEGATETELELTVTSASRHPPAGALVIWRNAQLRFRQENGSRGEEVPLMQFVAPETAQRLQFGQHPKGATIGESDFVLAGETTAPVKLRIPKGTTSARLTVQVELDYEHGTDSIVRCRIGDGEVAGKTVAAVGATSTLLANPASPAVAEWQTGVAEFARLLPEVSHREAAPSDRDPIPQPFDNAYNMPERNHFHYAIKYHRDDRFLVDYMLDDDTRRQLDGAWTDLLTSFDYHDASLRFVAKKFDIDLHGREVADLDPDTIEHWPVQPRAFAQRIRDEYVAMHAALRAAEADHVDDALRFATLAWRRPLISDEQQRLRTFYASLRRDEPLGHIPAMRALLTRILVAPAFLYRAEPATASTDVGPLSDAELASRLSYFLWSSLPDDELRRAAAAGELQDAEQLARQAQRMLHDPKARRLATEFFGQWFGFYRFDEYRGIDAGRFPELSDLLKAAMYDEAVSFFEHIVREDRPVSEILFADYAYLNEPLARHYGFDAAELPADRLVRVEHAAEQHRGGLLGLGAVLTVTSAPLRTSAVKRGDWILRRVIGASVPPPPADAGSIPADDAQADGLTVRQRLVAHRTDASCVNCHARFDPLGFALEHFDPIGRWRETYRDGRPIDATGTLSDGTEIADLDGLRRYLRREQPQFQRMLSAKLLGYALGRTEIASDRPLIDEMQSDLNGDGRFSNLVIRIVTSRQFRYRRS
ncbi:MAG TPA: DUF1592 domain-containing protein [Planctomycetaceae bacterium]|nr:DUF1592 domain-containing protein [Planctomycetaceae bacterium]